MGIRIDGTSDLINATDGSLTIEGQSINTTGIVTAASLVTADKIIHNGDTNTAIRFPAADTFSVETAGSERVRILSTGRVAIGTDSASSILHLKDGDNTIAHFGNHTYDDGVIQYYNGSFNIKTGSSNGDRLITLQTAGSERLRIDSSGRVGINSTSPTSKFEVIAADYDCVTLTTIENGTNGPQLELHHLSASPAASDTIGQVRFSSRDSAGNKDLMSKIETIIDDPTSGQETAHLNFGTRGLSSFNPILRLKNRGSASAPSYTTDDHNGIILDVYNTGNPYPRYMNIIAKSAGDTASNIAFWTEAVGGSPTEKLRITSAGKISTGALASPDGNLHVYNASAGSVTADTAGNIAVFEDSASNGISILVPASERANIYFGTPGTGGQIEGGIQYAHESVSTAADRRDMIFRVGGGEKVRFQGTGGISFNGDNAAANALDDYESGAWTPTDASGASLTFTSVNGWYVKVGDLVTMGARFAYPSTTNTNQNKIGGFPFSPGTDVYSVGSMMVGTVLNPMGNAGDFVGMDQDGRLRTANASIPYNDDLSGQTVYMSFTFRTD